MPTASVVGSSLVECALIISLTDLYCNVYYSMQNDNINLLFSREMRKGLSRATAVLMSNKKGPISSIITVDRSFYYVGGMGYSSSPENSLFDLFRDEIFF